MRTWLKRCWPPVGAACVLFLALAGSFQAQDKKSVAEKSVAEKHDAKALHGSLRDVINTGAELFNKQGDYAGCYRLYHGALLAVKPFLAPALQKSIGDALAAAENMPRMSDRAFALRKVIDDIRAQAVETIPPPQKFDDTPPKALWYRLGGEAVVRKMVEDFSKAAAADPKVNTTRDGKYKLDDEGKKLRLQLVVEFLSSITGGPLTYTGRTMKESHRRLAITDAEYTAAEKHIKAALEKNGAKPADAAEFMKKIAGLRKDIVEVKAKKVEKKIDDKGVKASGGEAGKVSGRVVFKGKPAPIGYLTLVSTDNRRYSTFIQAKGAYAFKTAIPSGLYRVAFERAPDQAPLKIDIPDRFRNEATSGLTVQVTAGSVIWDVDLPN